MIDNTNENAIDPLALVRDLDLGHECKFIEPEVVYKAEIQEGYQSWEAPEVGLKHPTLPNLISAGKSGWDWFDCQEMKFTGNVMRIKEEALKDVFRVAAWLNADEIIIQDDEPIAMEVPGRIVSITTRILSRTEIQEMFAELIDTTVPSKVSNGQDVDFAFTIPWRNKKGLTKHLRLRGNGVATIGTNGASEGCTYTIRKVGDEPPLYESLKFLPYLDKVLFPQSGMVVFCGETSSGKTTAIGGILRKIVSKPNGGVLVTFENPVEFVYREVKHPDYRVGQTDMTRSLEGDFARACVNAMRRRGDTILIGEVRDDKTAKGCFNLAQSSHAVYTTFHAGSPMDFFNRWLILFPADEHDMIRRSLISCVNVIMCVRLLNTLDGGRVQIRGSLVINDAVRGRLRAASNQDFLDTLQKVYEEQGNTMRDDLRRNREKVTRHVYKEAMYNFQGGHNDAEEVYPEVENAEQLAEV